jgi:LytS/YehU family sensor histidine kinase
MYISLVTLLLIVFSVALSVFVAFLLFKNKKNHQKNQELISEYRVLENKLNTIELEGLNYKINPHLFKNILNSIQSHAYQTYYSLDKLSNVLDYILYETDKQFVSPKAEIEFALNLIEINKLKLSPLFDIKIKNKTGEEHPLYHQDLLVPMISADLIENAFKHADLQSADAFIAITFELKDDYFALTVANKISGKPSLKKPKSGLGKQNLEKRLEIIYKGCYQLDQFEENNVFISHLKLNLLEYKIKVFTAG